MQFKLFDLQLVWRLKVHRGLVHCSLWMIGPGECGESLCLCVVQISCLFSFLLPSLLRCVEGHRHGHAVAHVSNPFDRQQLLAIHFPQYQDPAFILRLGKPGSLGLTVLLPLKTTHTHTLTVQSDRAKEAHTSNMSSSFDNETSAEVAPCYLSMNQVWDI